MNQNSNKTILSILAGITDPVLKKWAQKLASSVPSESSIRTGAFESVVGALKGILEVQSEKLSPATGVLVEKVTDFSDFFSGALGPQSGLDLEKWTREILNDAGQRLKEAEDPTAELERIKLEYQLRKQLAEIIRQDIPTHQPAIEKAKEGIKKAAKELDTVIEKELRPGLDRLNSRLTVIRDKTRAWAERGKKK